MSLSSVPSKLTVVTVCDMNQYALDFEGNYIRIRDSILTAKAQGSRYRLGPELETCGYSCEDHLLEIETLNHNYSIIAKVLGDEQLYDIVIDIGFFVQHCGVRYNARIIILNGKILLIRPKTVLASDKCYYESRWFTRWSHKDLQEWTVPPHITEICNQKSVPIGVAVIDFSDTCIGIQICEEVYVPDAYHQCQVFNGAEIITNGSANMFEVGKLATLLDLIRDASEKGKCGYMYSALSGFDGGRAYFDGGSLIYSCGRLRHIIPRFKIHGRGFTTMTTFIDLDEIRAKRCLVPSWTFQASRVPVLPKIKVEWTMCVNGRDFMNLPHQKKLSLMDAIEQFCDPLEELIGATTCWLWDYFVASQTSGFIVSLNGKPNSTAVIVLIFILCNRLFDTVTVRNDKITLGQIRTILGNDQYFPKSANELCSNFLVTVLFTCNDVSEETIKLVKSVSQEMETVHFEIPLEDVCQNHIKQTSLALGVNSDSLVSSKTLLSLKHRQQMVQCYLLAQLYTENKAGRSTQNLSKNPLLVLGTANADKSAMGFFTKYGCCSGDIGILSDMSKENVLDILTFAQKEYSLKTLAVVLENYKVTEKFSLSYFLNKDNDSKMNKENRTPKIEVCTQNVPQQSASIDYKEINTMRTLRKKDLHGPLTMFRTLADMWYFSSEPKIMSLEDIAAKVKLFFLNYSNNRHKNIILPPAVHLSASGQNDYRDDFRPVVYKKLWKFQFRCIDDEVKSYKIS